MPKACHFFFFHKRVETVWQVTGVFVFGIGMWLRSSLAKRYSKADFGHNNMSIKC